MWTRAAVLSVVALATGAFAHVQADGLLPGVGALVALVACGTLAGAPFLRRPGTPLRIVSLLVAGQCVVHTALAATAGHRGDAVARVVSPAVSPAPAAGERRGSYFDVAYAPSTAGHDGGLSIPAPLLHAITDMTAHPMMALAHLLAAAACGWWLAMGERALWRVLALTARGWSDLVAPSLLRWTLAARAVAQSALGIELPALAVVVLEPRPHSAVRSRSVSRRGPPRAV